MYIDERNTGNYITGISLICILIAGLPANITAFTYFATREARRPNRKYFKVTYMIITAIDTLICLAIIPVIEATFQPDREGKMFNNENFCQMWGIIWVILPNMSIFMVCVLSVSRYLVLRRAAVRLHVRLCWMIPLMCLSIIFLLLLTTFSTQTITMIYRPQFFLCGPKGADKPGDEDDRSGLFRGVISAVLFTTIPGLTFIPISISFYLTLRKLRQARNLAFGVGGCTRRQYEASITVVVVTTVYMIFNLPFSLTALGFIIRLLKIIFSQQQDWQQIFDVMREGEDSALNIVGVLFFLVFLVANSAANPFVYFTRMNNFRSYVRVILGDSVAVVLNTL